MSQNIEKVSLSIYALSKLAKFKTFVESNPEYFETVIGSTFDLILKSSNDLSILIDSIN
jgi:hypothetical protein